MKSKQRICLFALILLVGGLAFADGGAGGFFVGQYVTSFAGFESDTEAGFLQGGLGYGVGRNGAKIGGWGLALWGGEDQSDFLGGFGGTVHGYERDLGPIHLGVTGLVGVGYANLPTVSSPLAFFGEATLEVGIAVTNWFMVQGYGGGQLIANILSGMPFSERNFSWTYGVRILWGSFN